MEVVRRGVRESVTVELDTEPNADSGASFNGKSIPTYDQDNTHSMTERDEYNVRDVSEWSDGTKQQPSWERGPAGKSTKQGSSKTWAP